MTNDEKENNNNDSNLLELIVYDDNDKECERRVYVDEKGRWLWIAFSKAEIFQGKGEYFRCTNSQRKDLLKLITEIKRDYRKETEYHINNRIVTKEEHQKFKKSQLDKLR